MLTTDDHDRDAAGMRYIYPVASRRAGGLSIGVNLNPNNACNWRCCYCQVPNLARGHAPTIDLGLLRDEFSAMLRRVLRGDFLRRELPEGMQRLSDVAISGNGEPTSSAQFAEIVALLVAMMEEAGLPATVPLRLITNGSYCGKALVQQGLRAMAARGGEVWIKVDGGDAATIARVNGVTMRPERLRWQVEQAADCCPTWIQTCLVTAAGDGDAVPSDAVVDHYLRLIAPLAPRIAGVHLYAPLRPSHQQAVVAPSPEWMQAVATKIGDLGIRVRLA